ncbi:hypothetical protein PTTG_29356 [Puccinia triticina 1-1 BBBD Race 1]|uniref:Uncharacterized protein n=1 Tax=Puccinia triticina (isolate 1-1 / race 1 (BBBD)) TaxID=630390 RepID=A0A180G585_PUCT1|nr:hypothetical protein PTTG_29356 [Puccinia triticina 1-1 BBBD Race 1]
MRDTNLRQHPPPQPVQFDPVSTAFTDTPNFARFAFVPNTKAPVPQLQPGETFQSARGNPQQGRPLSFPLSDHPIEGTDGNPKHLGRFLQLIRDFLYPQEAFFSSQARMIVWISRHFGYQPTDPSRNPSPAKNWYNSLISTNARAQNVLDPYADLD